MRASESARFATSKGIPQSQIQRRTEEHQQGESHTKCNARQRTINSDPPGVLGPVAHHVHMLQAGVLRRGLWRWRPAVGLQRSPPWSTRAAPAQPNQLRQPSSGRREHRRRHGDRFAAMPVETSHGKPNLLRIASREEGLRTQRNTRASCVAGFSLVTMDGLVSYDSGFQNFRGCQCTFATPMKFIPTWPFNRECGTCLTGIAGCKMPFAHRPLKDALRT